MPILAVICAKLYFRETHSTGSVFHFFAVRVIKEGAKRFVNNKNVNVYR